MSKISRKTKGPRIPEASLAFMEKAYKSGNMSNVKIGKAIGKGEAFVRKWVKHFKWKKSLHGDVMRKANETLVLSEGLNEADVLMTDEDGVNAMSDAVVRVVREQRGVLGKARIMAEQFLVELEIASKYPDEMTRIAEIVSAQMNPEDDKAHAKQLAAFMKLIGLQGRTTTLTNLAKALSSLIKSEREAFGMDGEMGKGGSEDNGFGGFTMEELLSEIIKRDFGETICAKCGSVEVEL